MRAGGKRKPELHLLLEGYKRHLADGWAAVLFYLQLFGFSADALGKDAATCDRAIKKVAKWVYQTGEFPLGTVVHGLLATQRRVHLNRYT